ncbi:carotenoid ester lipase precursor [Cyathus striatus]|nr:carotenoid ester lipase precursor [Cyathus striatus]
MKATFASLVHLFFLSTFLSTPIAYAAPANASVPVVKLDYGFFQGVGDGNLVKFLGMPFAAPPVGNLRFTPPQSPLKFSGVRQAASYGLACPQQAAKPSVSALPPPLQTALLTNIGRNVSASEDCLFINVIAPASIPHGKKLPVVFWIYGGGYEFGDTSFNTGDPVVNRSIALNEPVECSFDEMIAFGFLGGKEAQAAGAGNAGIKDQRFALQWVQKNIAKFGGDPRKVTIECWGSFSWVHLVLNDGHTEGLYRAAVMQSGSPIQMRSILAQQPVYDQLVSILDVVDQTYFCLSPSIPYDTLLAAVNKSPGLFSFQSLNLAYQPSVDGKLITRNPITSVKKGLYARVPIISGDTDDEGTLFSLSNLNITTDAELRDYISSVYFPGITDTQLDQILTAYPANDTLGSPFDTGSANALGPQFKRLAAFQGDFEFQAPRRFFMQAAAKTQPTYGFMYKRGKAVPFIAAFHTSDVTEFYGSGAGADFIATDALSELDNQLRKCLDPNSHTHNNISLLSTTHWPLYSSSREAPPMFTFTDPAPAFNITADTFRQSALQVLTAITAQLFPA